MAEIKSQRKFDNGIERLMDIKRINGIICVISVAHTLLGGTRTVVNELLYTLKDSYQMILLSLKTQSKDEITERILKYYNICPHPKLWKLFGPWHILTLPLYEFCGFVWCLCLRLSGVRAFLVQDPIYSGFFTALVAKLTKSKLLVFDYGFLINLWGNDLENMITFQNPYQRGGVAKIYINIMRMFVKCSLSTCDRFFIYSDDMERYAYSAGLRKGKAVRFLFPIDTELFKPIKDDERKRLKIELGVDSNRLLVTYLGRLSRDKGLPYILQALKILLKRSKMEFTFLFVGDGPMKNVLLARIREYPKGLIRYLGPATNSNNVFRILGASDIFVYPIIVSNGYAMSFLEAMAAGIPGIITDVGPTKDVLDNGCALIIPRKDSFSLANAIELLGINPIVRAQMASKAAELVRLRFPASAYRTTILQILNQYL